MSRSPPPPPSTPPAPATTGTCWITVPELEARGIDPGRHAAVRARQPHLVLPVAQPAQHAASQRTSPGASSPSTSWTWASPHRTGVFRRLADRVNDLGDLTTALGLTARSSPWATTGAASSPWAGPWNTADLLAGVVLTNTAVHPAGLRASAGPEPCHCTPRSTAGAPHVSGAFLRVTHRAGPARPANRSPGAFMAPTAAPPAAPGWAISWRTSPPTRRTPAGRPWIRISAGIIAERSGTDALGPQGPGVLRPVPARSPRTGCRRPMCTASRAPAICCPRTATSPLRCSTGSRAPRPSTGTAEIRGNASTAARPRYRPMLAELDARRNDPPAVVDMALDINPPGT